MSDKSEGVAELFFNMLKTSTNPGSLLSQLFSTVTGVGVGRADIIKINQLVKVFGKTSVFFSILELGKKEGITNFPYGLIYRICMDRLESAFEAELTISSYESLDKRISEAIKLKNSTKKVDVEKVMRLLKEDDNDQ